MSRHLKPSTISMVDLKARHRSLGSRGEEALLEVLRSGQWVGGAVLQQAESALAAHFGRRHGVGVNSGTDALVLALLAIGVGPGHEVIVPALSFFATAGAVALVGARPVVADVLPSIPLMDPDSARERLSPRTRAVIPVHLFGMACPCPDLDLPIIEDAAQAAGYSPPIAMGQVTATSFYPTKTLGAPGDAGLAATDDPGLARRIRRLANHGISPGKPHYHELVAGSMGRNSRMDPLHAALLMVQLEGLPARVRRRRQIAATYDQALPPSISPVPRTAGDPIHHYLLRCSRRKSLLEHLSSLGVGTAVYYPRPLSTQPALQPQPPTPVAQAWCQEILSIPCRATLDDRQVERICQALRSFRY